MWSSPVRCADIATKRRLQASPPAGNRSDGGQLIPTVDENAPTFHPLLLGAWRLRGWQSGRRRRSRKPAPTKSALNRSRFGRRCAGFICAEQGHGGRNIQRLLDFSRSCCSKAPVPDNATSTARIMDFTVLRLVISSLVARW